ncbi:MAG: hypothetical protein QG656_1199 [Candidatus Hydrogenedentes bacterium]|nr:hypothetical protein [Candidatus Hydrogenedentota bacterium]
MARKNNPETPPPVDPELTYKAMAKAVCEGDVVNFRLLFAPFSPARDDSTEQFSMDKYAYLLPSRELEEDRTFKDALGTVRRVEVRTHLQQELKANRPAQLPSELLLPLADNAVRRGKYTSAAQAYELLRVRRRVQDEFIAQADAALDEGQIGRGVYGYVIATGLDYDYAAFPEPLPKVPDYQTLALLMHADYPHDPANAIPMQPEDQHIRTALGYLLHNAEVAARLDARPLEVRVQFAEALVRRLDPEWNAFAERFREACVMAERFTARFKRAQEEGAKTRMTLADEIEQTLGDDPRSIAAHLLGRVIPEGEWWQYLKELAYAHPAAILFLRRVATGDHEVLAPQYRSDSPLAQALDLVRP